MSTRRTVPPAGSWCLRKVENGVPLRTTVFSLPDFLYVLMNCRQHYSRSCFHLRAALAPVISLSLGMTHWCALYDTTSLLAQHAKNFRMAFGGLLMRGIRLCGDSTRFGSLPAQSTSLTFGLMAFDGFTGLGSYQKLICRFPDVGN